MKKKKCRCGTEQYCEKCEPEKFPPKLSMKTKRRIFADRVKQWKVEAERMGEELDPKNRRNYAKDRLLYALDAIAAAGRRFDPP